MYSSFREGWDHDHCEMCGAKFGRTKGDLRYGYVTSDDYHWVCETCFADFRDEML